MARHKRISGARAGGLTKWFNEKWVDISRPKKAVDLLLADEEKQARVVILNACH